MLINRTLVAVALLCSLQLIGCSSNVPAYEVVGTVEFEDGTVPMFGNIEFYSTELKINAQGKIKRDGTFSVSTFQDGDGAVLGHHQVVVMQQAGSYLLAKEGIKIDHDHGSLIDKTHFDYRTSGLSCEIQAGRNEVNLVVKKLPRQTKEGLPR